MKKTAFLLFTLATGLCFGSESSTTWSDLNKDGWEDFLIHGPAGQLRLFQNLGDGSFREMTGALGLDAREKPSVVKEADFDGNGLADFFLLTEGGRSSLLLQTAGFAFARSSSLQASGEELPSAMSVSWRDFDRDGREDLVLQTSEGEPRAFRNLGNGRFESAALLASGPPPLSGFVVSGVSGPLAIPFPGPACEPSVKDQATGDCLEASSVPTLGMLYPLSDKLSVDAAGLVKVGVGIQFPNGSVQSSAQAVGPQGPIGPQGPQGPTGPAGAPGKIQSINGLNASDLFFLGTGGTSVSASGGTIVIDSSGAMGVTGVNGKIGSVTLQGQGGTTISNSPTGSTITISSPISTGISSLNGQDGPSIIIQGSGGTQVVASNDMLTISSPPSVTSINGASGPAINIQGTGGAQVSSSGNTITISVPSAICTWSGKTYSTGSTCYWPTAGGNCLYPDKYQAKYTCSSSGAWSSGSSSCSTGGLLCGQ